MFSRAGSVFSDGNMTGKILVVNTDGGVGPPYRLGRNGDKGGLIKWLSNELIAGMRETTIIVVNFAFGDTSLESVDENG